jgi:hypothetical protein
MLKHAEPHLVHPATSPWMAPRQIAWIRRANDGAWVAVVLMPVTSATPRVRREFKEEAGAWWSHTTDGEPQRLNVSRSGT